MKITLVTPCFNAAPFLEETIKSVIAQDVPELEYIVADGGSTDGTVEILQRYASRFAWWVSEPDRGQASAINEGFARASGDILGFLNADDVLQPGALRAVQDAFASQPEVDLIYGEVNWIDAHGQPHGFHAGDISSLDEILDIYRVWWRQRQWVQPEVFFRRSLTERVGKFDEDYHLAFDYDYWVRCFLAGARVAKVPEQLVRFRRHAQQKSAAAEEAADEIRAIVRRTLAANPPISRGIRRRLEAQLSYDLYQLGRDFSPREPRPAFLPTLCRHPEWLLFSPEVRARVQAACMRRLFGEKNAALES